MKTPDLTPAAIGAFCVLVATNVIVLLGLDLSESRKAAIAGLINAAVIVGFLIHDAIVRHGRATGLPDKRS